MNRLYFLYFQKYKNKRKYKLVQDLLFLYCPTCKKTNVIFLSYLKFLFIRIKLGIYINLSIIKIKSLS